jgi:hypothetical protein
MNQKQRARAALAGEPVDRYPVTALYNMLYYQDHFSELTGLPAWKMHAWPRSRSCSRMPGPPRRSSGAWKSSK